MAQPPRPTHQRPFKKTKSATFTLGDTNYTIGKIQLFV